MGGDGTSDRIEDKKNKVIQHGVRHCCCVVFVFSPGIEPFVVDSHVWPLFGRYAVPWYQAPIFLLKRAKHTYKSKLRIPPDFTLDNLESPFFPMRTRMEIFNVCFEGGICLIVKLYVRQSTCHWQKLLLAPSNIEIIVGTASITR